MAQLFEEHAREHVAHPELSASERAQGLEDLLTVIRRYAK
jgi:DNA-binding FrmR family transcriptional regulator